MSTYVELPRDGYVDNYTLQLGVAGPQDRIHSAPTGKPIVGPYCSIDSSAGEYAGENFSLDDLETIGRLVKQYAADPKQKIKLEIKNDK